MVTAETRNEMKKILAEIRNGTYARNWIQENEKVRPWFEATRAKEQEHLIERVGAEKALVLRRPSGVQRGNAFVEIVHDLGERRGVVGHERRVVRHVLQGHLREFPERPDPAHVREADFDGLERIAELVERAPIGLRPANPIRTPHRFEPAEDGAVLRSESFGREHLVGFGAGFEAEIVEPFVERRESGPALRARCEMRVAGGLTLGSSRTPDFSKAAVVQMTIHGKAAKD